MDQNFTTMFEDVRHERSLILLLLLTDSDILNQSQLTEDETNILTNLALDKSDKNYTDNDH